ncbi:methyltransferase domain protein [Synechococcus sp. PROS-U-1]|nr:methyltransferase domain protein [Synechococcus sp. PROS-U-1]
MKSNTGNKILQKADIIIYADVLEHLSDPWTHLKKINLSCRENTKIVASVPNYFHHSAQRLLSKYRFDYEEWGVLDLTHMRFFGLENIVEMFEECGWEVKKDKIIPVFDPEGQKIVERIKKDGRYTWKEGKLSWEIESELDAIKLGSYQFVVECEKR